MSSVTWAFGSTTYTELSKTHSPFLVNLNRSLIAFPLFLIVYVVCILTGTISIQEINSTAALWLFFSMFCSYGLGDSCFFTASRWIGVPASLAIASLYPFWTTLWGVIFQGEQTQFHHWLGLTITLTGVVLIVLSTPHKTKLEKKTAVYGFLFSLFTSLFWSLNTYSVAQAGKTLSALGANTIRMFFAILITFTLAKISNEKQIFFKREVYKKNMPIFIFEAFGGSFFFAFGLAHSSLLLGSTLSSLAPVLAVPIGWAYKTEKPIFSKTLGVILTLIGLTLLIQS